ncbi:Hsp20/alpha crystallin family protein [Sulfurimonas sp.]|uniref:Hsp20/alpha crystallin family protein n=1 Tax=Sulfurimonas sp. TaxID=2022749 RepID=UPI003569C5BF
MLLTKYNPYQELRDLNKRFHHLSNAYPKFDIAHEYSIAGFTPAMNTREGEFAYHIDVDLPGVKKDDIKVDIKDNVLTISGERTLKSEVKEEDYYKIETSFGKFQRSFTLPDSIDTESITASAEDGVLEIVIPKSPKILHKKEIKVK